MNLYFKPVVIAVLCTFLFPVLSQSACLMGARIQPTLCGRLDSVTADQLVPVNITMYEPVIRVPLCEDRSNPPPSGAICAQLYADSEAAYWNRQKSEWIRVFSECPVWDTATLSHRLDSTDFKVAIYYSGLATKQTIITLASEQLIRSLDLGFYFRLPDSVLHATTFPFDTVLIGCFSMNDSGLVKFNNSEIMISRYNLPLFFWRTPDPLWFPEHFSWDFETNLNENRNIIKYPVPDYITNGFRFLITSCECHGMPSCSSWLQLDTAGYRSFEYRLRTVTSFLYMKVLDGSKPDSIKVRFDTRSFLGTAVVRALGSRPAQSRTVPLQRGAAFNASVRNAMLHGALISVYSIDGRKIVSAAIMRSGIVVVKKIENGRISYTRNVLAW
jgi:hypothetical protein